MPDQSRTRQAQALSGRGSRLWMNKLGLGFVLLVAQAVGGGKKKNLKMKIEESLEMGGTGS